MWGQYMTRSPWPAVFASVMGWAFDLFDLFLLLYVAGPVGRQIFPAESETLSLALVFASFAVSILMRPGGAVLFGELADRAGRKKSMVVVLAGVGTATAAMGFVPTYATAGVVAPIIFLVLRIIQGVFVGGVTATTHTLGTETVGPRWRGLMSGMVGGFAAGLGAALASICFIVVSAFFPGDRFDEMGWRVMFWTGLLGAVLSLFVLRKVEESPMWEEARARAKTGLESGSQPVRLRDLLSRRYRVVLLLNLAVASGIGGMYYLTAGFLPTLLDSVMGMPPAERGDILLVASIGIMLGALATGALSERIGRRKTMLGMGAVNLIALPLLTLGIVTVDSGRYGIVMLLGVVLAMLGNAAAGVLPIFLNERYPTELRSRGTAISWNIGFMIGGLLPTFVNLLSPRLDAIPSRLAVFLVAVGALLLVAVVLSPETRGNLDRPAARLDAE